MLYKLFHLLGWLKEPIFHVTHENGLSTVCVNDKRVDNSRLYHAHKFLSYDADGNLIEKVHVFNACRTLPRNAVKVRISIWWHPTLWSPPIMLVRAYRDYYLNSK